MTLKFRKTILFTWLVLYTLPAASARSRIDARAWRRCTIRDQATFDSESPKIKSQTTYATSEFLCALMADVHEWVELWCYTGGQCTMWALDALIAGDTEFDSSGVCGKRLAQCDNIFENGSRLVEDDVEFEHTCMDGYVYKCHSDGIHKIDKTAKFHLSACGEHGFFSTAVGCLKVEEVEMTYSAARQNCLDYGADLFHASTADAIAQLPDILSDYKSYSDIWYGLTKLGGKWTWLNGRKLAPEEVESFTETVGEFFGKGKPMYEFRVADGPCMPMHPSLCIAKYLK